MKSLILATLVSLSVVATGIASANADTFTVHGYEGTHYGR